MADDYGSIFGYRHLLAVAVDLAAKSYGDDVTVHAQPFPYICNCDTERGLSGYAYLAAKV